ncbi:hypothetical protein ACFVYP_36055, partial [Kitasatospora sp. NPDC058201]|uniref:hypothetical protein n=1 Tax=unclassified Kitasatospora TaxID=2633591 RepID=UPI00364FF5DE
FLQAAFTPALRALRSFVFPAYQTFSAPFPALHSSDSRWGISFDFAPKLIKAFGVLSSGIYLVGEGAHS